MVGSGPCYASGFSVGVEGNNHVMGFDYDAAGNVTGDGHNSYTRNGAGELKTAAGVTYTYDGDGLMVDGGDMYWRAYTGQKLEDTDTSGFTQQDIIYFDGRPITWINATGAVDYMFADAQGSIRAVTDSSGNVSCTADYYPYGQEVGYGCGFSPYGFAGYEQLDNGSGNLYAFARFYSPRLGRFLSADPLGGSPENPQSLYRYTYVLNDPANLIDPLGLDCQDFTSYVDNGSGIPVPVTTVVCNGNGPVGQILTGVSNGGGCTAFLASGTGDCPPAVIPYMGPFTVRTQNPPQTTAKKGLFTCASDAAENVSIAADLHQIRGLKSGVGGFIVNALAGNPFSGLTDLIASFNTGEAGGHNVFYNMALADAAGPTQGFGPLFGKAIEGTPWAAGPTDVAMVGLFGEYATGVGEANVVFSGITYGLSLGACYFGWAH